MKRIVLPILFAATSALAAQTPADSGPAARMHHPVGRWREVLGLSDDQAAKLKATEQRFGDQRRAILERQRSLGLALRGQLHPGIAANVDSVRKLLDAREQNEGALAQLRRDENREMAGYLSPVQRARIQLMRERMAGRFAHMGWRRGDRGRGWGGGGEPARGRRWSRLRSG